MIWEVDEDCDGMVSWTEFQTMYTRWDHELMSMHAPMGTATHDLPNFLPEYLLHGLLYSC